MMQVDICDARTEKVLETFSDFPENATIADVKKLFAQARRKFYPDRQSYRLEPRGKILPDDTTLCKTGGRLYFKDLGPQIGWITVFLTEYAGPLFVYAGIAMRPGCLYGVDAASSPTHWAVTLAFACWTGHYAKRLLETLFVHRFSKNTMPIKNLFINCSYYWGFAAFISYYVNHPLYTPASFGENQIYGGLALFILGELGNFSIHVALRALRPAGSKVRLIPKPTSNPLTCLFSLVSCPNYTYEALSWIGFSVMTQCLPAAIFTVAGFYQMSVWAIGKHKAYKREFKDYPKGRKAIVPFLL